MYSPFFVPFYSLIESKFVPFLRSLLQRALYFLRDTFDDRVVSFSFLIKVVWFWFLTTSVWFRLRVRRSGIVVIKQSSESKVAWMRIDRHSWVTSWRVESINTKNNCFTASLHNLFYIGFGNQLKRPFIDISVSEWVFSEYKSLKKDENISQNSTSYFLSELVLETATSMKSNFSCFPSLCTLSLVHKAKQICEIRLINKVQRWM